MELLPVLAILPIILGIGFIIIIFLIFRTFWLWYWKINNIVELLEGIDAKLLVLKNNLSTNTEGE